MTHIETVEPDPRADVRSGTVHPRHTPKLFGQSDAEATFLAAWTGGRRHHAWMIKGPEGIGKATLAWRIARFVMANEPQTDGLFGAPDAPANLEIAPDHPVSRRVDALSEPRLLSITRPWDAQAKRFKAAITVDEVRRIAGFFALSVPDGGHRVVIVDAADEMNTNAANALLKTLEEPPSNTLILLVTHRPSRLLPTIRSRCRTLVCTPLGPEDLGNALAQAEVDPGTAAAPLAALSEGSVGQALELLETDGLALYAELVGLIAEAPAVDRARAIALAESVAGRGKEVRLKLLTRMIETLLARMALSGAGRPPDPEAAPDERQILARLSPGPVASRRWAETQQALSARAAHALAVNLDPATLILDTLLKINETAQDIQSGR
ncbi:MAG: DNA polymerase III subunit delta' [Pseudomonadota bacterium]